jgi:arylsulfatase A-like enzyme
MSILLWLIATLAFGATQDRHVLVVVWDGMRPDFVSEQNTPALWQLARDGVVFRNHHCVYPSATNVNGTAIATGCYPSRNGILANHVYRPELDAKKTIDVETAPVVEKGDLWSAGKYVSAPTMAELAQEAGLTTAIATAKTVGLLLDRHVDPERAKKNVTLFAGASLPGEFASHVASSLGPFPAHGKASEKDAWTTKALTDFLWHDQLPALSWLWLGEPDDTEHKTTVGSSAALEAMKGSDANLAQALAALDRLNARSTTDIFVVSDHGFSTIRRMIELPKILRSAGFNVATEFTAEPKAGDIMLSGNGGTVLFYVVEQQASVTRKLVEFLQQSDFAGVIFTKQKFEGTFPLNRAKIDNETAADVVMAFRWSDAKNALGYPGMIDGDWQRAAGEGTHATLSRFDMHNMLIAAGPDFKKGLTSELPSGNVDLAPTIGKILGLSAQMDGRVLSEAMNGSAPKVESETLEVTKKFPNGQWREYLKISRVGSTTYLDEGNGEFVPSSK